LEIFIPDIQYLISSVIRADLSRNLKKPKRLCPGIFGWESFLSELPFGRAHRPVDAGKIPTSLLDFEEIFRHYTACDGNIRRKRLAAAFLRLCAGLRDRSVPIAAATTIGRSQAGAAGRASRNAETAGANTR
jgi:hypothetical protein